jgi:hypothetical protein
MRTTLDLDDALARRAKKAAAARGTTLSRLIEDALRSHLAPKRRGAAAYKLEILTKQGSRAPAVDPADRDRLYDLLDERT